VGALLGTILSGALHGHLTNRWNRAAVDDAAERLSQIPLEIGPWRLKESPPLPQHALNILRCAGHLNRLYVHRDTGAEVLVTVLLGPPDTIWGHSPNGCYQFNHYTILQEPQRVEIPAGGSETHFWEIAVQSGEVDAQKLQIYYAWSDGGEWSAPDEPRFQFGARAFLYRIQAMSAIEHDADPSADTACRPFLDEFLPVVAEHLANAAVGLKLQR
jgi:hypothetical protein